MKYKIIRFNKYKKIKDTNLYEDINFFEENESQFKETNDKFEEYDVKFEENDDQLKEIYHNNKFEEIDYQKWIVAISNMKQNFIFVAISFNKESITEDEKYFDYVHHQNQHTKKRQPFKYNAEPWITDNHFEKMCVYLNQEESMQLYIGKCTLQVWRKIEQKENLFLEYFWANEDYENRYTFQIFELKVYKNVFEEIKYNISRIIWRFVRNCPENWKLLDIHYNLMAKIIISGSITLIKYILFGDKKIKHKYLHIPRINRWNDSEKSDESKKFECIVNYNLENTYDQINFSKLSDLQIAIKLCKQDFNRKSRILVVTYLLEYYTKNATENLGWLIAISKALPDLYAHKLEYFANELFYKRCIEGLEILNIIKHTEFVPREYLITSNKFIAFNPISKFILTIEPKSNFKTLENDLKLRLAKLYLKIFSKDYENYSPTIKLVPLHNFTVNSITQKTYNNEDNAEKFSQLSPFVQIIRSESNNDIFNNPVMEADAIY
ncbi:719_t:CDS:2 [Funneliformis geosporum]|nr:719_t:CDS:2 [Funneliformis geosporum]